VVEIETFVKGPAESDREKVKLQVEPEQQTKIMEFEDPDEQPITYRSEG